MDVWTSKNSHEKQQSIPKLKVANIKCVINLKMKCLGVKTKLKHGR